MTDEELQALPVELESDRVERKSSVSDPAKIKRAMCALACSDHAPTTAPASVPGRITPQAGAKDSAKAPPQDDAAATAAAATAATVMPAQSTTPSAPALRVPTLTTLDHDASSGLQLLEGGRGGGEISSSLPPRLLVSL